MLPFRPTPEQKVNQAERHSHSFWVSIWVLLCMILASSKPGVAGRPWCSAARMLNAKRIYT